MSDHGASIARLTTFTALAAFATVHWSHLVVAPPAGRLVLAVAIVAVAASVLELLSRLVVGRRAPALAAAVCLAAATLVMIAIGIPGRLLWPAGWGELASNVDFGLDGLAGEIDYPYAEGNAWSRLVILAAAPLTMVLAAASAFWPAREAVRRRLRLAGLAILVAAYATAVAAVPPEAPLLDGAILLLLVGAWLWLPAVRWREAAIAAALLAIAGAVAVPAAAQLDSGKPWFDYRSWVLRTAEGKTFGWEHSYGPIDWDRDGTRMLSVESAEANYWKTVVLDRFDGIRWTRSPESNAGSRVLDGETTIARDDDGRPRGADDEWVRRMTFSVGNLTSDIVVGAGTPLRVEGLGGVISAPDGTTATDNMLLENGDAYRVTAYVPDPTATRMRIAPQQYDPALARYTRVELPSGSAALNGADSPVVTVPLRGEPRREEVDRALADSPYRQVHDLARGLVEGEPTAYDATRAIQDHLRSGEYSYSEVPPARSYPLAAFLFEDQRGYCQQFSGAMALMLRTVGIPSRVVSGFAPGTRDEETGVFRVEDFDAHSWVEVYFEEIGWVAFDPTPPSAPAASQQVSGFPTSAASRAPQSPEAAELNEQGVEEETAAGSRPRGGSGGAGGLLAVPAGLALALALGSAVVGIRTIRHRRLPAAVAVDAQLGELAAALERFGWRRSSGATLLSLESRLRRSRRPAAARYLARMRALRYGSADGQPPTLTERRALRRDLAATRGLGGRLRALLAIPPGGPRVPRSR